MTTNYERIKNMTIEEMFYFLVKVYNITTSAGENYLKQWLQSECENDSLLNYADLQI